MKISSSFDLKKSFLKRSAILLVSAGMLAGYSADAQRNREPTQWWNKKSNNNNQRSRSNDNNQRSRSNDNNQRVFNRQSNSQDRSQRRMPANSYSNNNNNRTSVGWTDRLRYNAVARDRASRYSSYNPSWRYVNRPRYHSTVNYVPYGYRTIRYGGYDYRYHSGIFYRPYNNLFMVVSPPIGIYIDILPVGYRRVYVRDYPYYYYNGTFYDEWDHHYRVVSPPVGAIVESIPEGYKTITIDGETYYEVDGAQYKPIVQDNGEIWYEVIKAN